MCWSQKVNKTYTQDRLDLKPILRSNMNSLKTIYLWPGKQHNYLCMETMMNYPFNLIYRCKESVEVSGHEICVTFYQIFCNGSHVLGSSEQL